MSALEWNDIPELDHPLVVVAFQGWFDAGEAATDAVDCLADLGEAVEIARIDSEPFFNFQEQRPTVAYGTDGDRVITWPDTVVRAVRPNGASRDLVLISGVEPHLRWPSFCRDILSVIEHTGAEMVVTLGAMVAVVPHTRPLVVTGSSTTPELARRLGLNKPSYQGPTGVVGTLHDALDGASVPVISLRVGIPHYVPGPPNPSGTKALLQQFQRVTGMPTDPGRLDGPIDEWRGRVDLAVADDPDVVAYVAQVEAQADAEADEIPSGDDLAAELEQFLREQSDE
ncbi:MAG: PAC2 family protein [Actinomycetia bacterium]|nr:PAC2 family protein [Actinomycetes bacterium]MCP4086644.1 PAC2 family protein [Actinomycetes bacterium]